MQSPVNTARPLIGSGALSYLSLFTSLSTLLCCALPSLFVLFGLGATVASLLSQAPWLVLMSHHKHWVFLMAGLLITANFAYMYTVAPKLQAKNGSCDQNDPAACQTARRFGRIVLWCSAVLYLIGCLPRICSGRYLCVLIRELLGSRLVDRRVERASVAQHSRSTYARRVETRLRSRESDEGGRLIPGQYGKTVWLTSLSH